MVSDTHGLVRPEALAALRGSDLILHAGDVGGRHVLELLEALAPVVAVRGNNDDDAWGRVLPETADLTLAGARIHVRHDLHALDIDPAAAGVQVVVTGHSHRPRRERRGGVLFFNPGSAGPRRFSLPVSVGRLVLAAGAVRATLVRLDVPPSSRR